MTKDTHPAWTPYAVGAGLGALSCFTFLTAQKPLGVTTPFEDTAAALAQKTAPDLTRVNRYLASTDTVPTLGWEWMLDAGIVLGSFLAARTFGGQPRGAVPARWASRFGPSPTRRYVGAFLGGALMMFGARLASGCTSGHAISGNLQLAGSSWTFSPLMGLCAAAAARGLFGKGVSCNAT